MILYPNAKVNIGLNIKFKRDDGFHELETLMYPVNLTDKLTMEISKNRNNTISFTSDGISIDGNPEDNLIVKAYKLLDSIYNLPSMDVHLQKLIPFGAGLGGGSADCSFAIKGISELCNLKLSIEQMEKLSTELGSDCPFFIENEPAIAKGRGEQLESFDINLDNYHFVIVIPPLLISTKKAYSLVKPKMPSRNLSELLELDIESWRNLVKNDFENSVFSQYPEIRDIKDSLYKKGAKYAALSGSGSAVFGIFQSRADLTKAFPENYFIWQS